MANRSPEQPAQALVEAVSNRTPRPSRENNFNLGRELTEEEKAWVDQVCAEFPDDENESDRLEPFDVVIERDVIGNVGNFFNPGKTRNDAISYILHGRFYEGLDEERAPLSTCNLRREGESLSGISVVLNSRGEKVAVFYDSGRRNVIPISSQDEIISILFQRTRPIRN